LKGKKYPWIKIIKCCGIL